MTENELRAIPAEFDSRRLAQIDNRLSDISESDGVSIGLAIESGSRAWGFPSPDSDFDCRFIFIRRRNDYLSPWWKRDVIETPLIDEIDLNGWDLGKALTLMLKGNAVVIEWMMSPIIYRGGAEFRSRFAELARRHARSDAIARHYLHLGLRQQRTYFGDGKDIQLKKLFYALRPAVALRWLRLNPVKPIAPMHFPTLLAESDVSQALQAIVSDLISRKAETRELGSGPVPSEIREFIDNEFAVVKAKLPKRATPIAADAKSDADDFFRWAVQHFDPYT